MRTRSSFIMATVAWPLPLVAVAARADGRSVAAGLAWAGFVGLGAWSVVRLLGGGAVMASGVVAGALPQGIPAAREADARRDAAVPGDLGLVDADVVADVGVLDAVDPDAAGAGRAGPRAVTGEHRSADELVRSDLDDLDGLDDDGLDDDECLDGLDDDRLDDDGLDDHGLDDDDPDDLDDCGPVVVDIAVGLARLEAFANGGAAEPFGLFDGDQQPVAGETGPLLGGAED